MAAKLRVIQPLLVYDFLSVRTESAQDFIDGFSGRWLGNYPKPKLVLMDSAKSFVSDAVRDFLSNLNIQVHFIAEKESWAHGTVEAAVQDVKHTASAIFLDNHDLPMPTILHLTVQALNATEYTAGFSAHQWCFGAKYTLSDEDERTHAAADPQLDFVRLVNARA